MVTQTPNEQELMEKADAFYEREVDLIFAALLYLKKAVDIRGELAEKEGTETAKKIIKRIGNPGKSNINDLLRNIQKNAGELKRISIPEFEKRK